MKIKILSAIIIFSSSIFLLSILEGWMCKPMITDDAIIKQSVTRGLLLLQKSGYVFTKNNKFKCASCHHNTLTAMAEKIAIQKGIPVIDSFTVNNITAMENTIIGVCNPNLINQFLPVNFAIPYILLGLNAKKYPANMYTDISVDYIMSQAKPDGSFLAESGRVPLETGDIHLNNNGNTCNSVICSRGKEETCR